MELNIHNNSPRQVLCLSTQKDVYGGRGGVELTLDSIYNVEKIEVRGYYTVVFLKEFPGIGFNSVLFGEVE